MIILYVIGRVIFGLYFLKNAYNHLVKTDSLAGYAQMKGVPSPKAAVIVSGLLLLVGGLSYVVGYQMYWGTIALLVFMIITTFKMHAFWKETDPQRRGAEEVQFYKNFAIIGALLMMF